MSDFTTLQARAEYTRDTYLREAAHERLLRQIRPAVAAPSAARPKRASRGRRLLIAAVLALLLIPLVPHPTAATVETLPAPAISDAAAAPAPGATAGCWITRDLVGEANPAVIAAAVCGH